MVCIVLKTMSESLSSGVGTGAQHASHARTGHSPPSGRGIPVLTMVHPWNIDASGNVFLKNSQSCFIATIEGSTISVVAAAAAASMNN